MSDDVIARRLWIETPGPCGFCDGAGQEKVDKAGPVHYEDCGGCDATGLTSRMTEVPEGHAVIDGKVVRLEPVTDDTIERYTTVQSSGYMSLYVQLIEDGTLFAVVPDA